VQPCNQPVDGDQRAGREQSQEHREHFQESATKARRIAEQHGRVANHFRARSRKTARSADARAVTLALEAIAHDGRARSVNLAPATLADTEFSSRLRALLFGQARAARLLSIEIDEAAAVERFASLRELARLVRPCGVRFGLEHAGRRLATIDHLFEDWLDFVKLDASLGSGAAGDAQRAGYVRAAVDLLHGLAIDVYAEGVRDAADAAALWACGIDGITGPWATTHHA